MVVVAGLIGFGGAWLGSHATIVTQRDQARETRQAEARTKRARTYSAFLNTANDYSTADNYLQELIDRLPNDLCRRTKGRRTCSALNELRSDWFGARNKFRSALDQVNVYGSSAGVRAARRLAASLPTTLNDETGLISNYDGQSADFPYAHAAFLNVMCGEVSSDPRPTC